MEKKKKTPITDLAAAHQRTFCSLLISCWLVLCGQENWTRLEVLEAPVLKPNSTRDSNPGAAPASQ